MIIETLEEGKKLQKKMEQSKTKLNLIKNSGYFEKNMENCWVDLKYGNGSVSASFLGEKEDNGIAVEIRNQIENYYENKIVALEKQFAELS